MFFLSFPFDGVISHVSVDIYCYLEEGARLTGAEVAVHFREADARVIFQNYGTGKETPRGNPGDIGRSKVRQARRWFDKKYYGSVMNLRDFLGESLSQQYIGIVSNALSDRDLRASATVSDT